MSDIPSGEPEIYETEGPGVQPGAAAAPAAAPTDEAISSDPVSAADAFRVFMGARGPRDAGLGGDGGVRGATGVDYTLPPAGFGGR
jgi:hypothetical protein